MAGSSCAIRGSFFDFKDNPWNHTGREQDAARFIRDGLLVVRDGIIADFGPFAEVTERHAGLEITSIPGRLILPGFIDGHIHFPQVRAIGAYGKQLLEWLQAWILPEELKYRDRAYADEAAKHFFDNLLAAGTTTCMAFTTSSPVSAEAFFEEAARRNMRVIAGLTGMDRFAPDDCLIRAEDFDRESRRLIERYHRQGRNLYAITPRYAVGSTPQMLECTRELKKDHPDCWINTHISETPTEVRMAKGCYPDCHDYTEIYERYGFLGPKFMAGHGIWLSNDEFSRLGRAGAGLAFCPLSNLYLGSGLFRLGHAMDPKLRLRLALGADMGAGNAFSLIRVLEEAYKVGMCNSTMLDGSVNAAHQDLAEAERNVLGPYRGFYLATLGGARALYLDDLLGNFEVNKEADFVVLDWKAGQRAMAWHQELVCSGDGPATIEQAAQLLFSIMVLGDDRNIDETWIAGKRAYKKGS